MKGCVFCDVITDNEPHHEIWWRDEDHVAFLDVTPNQPGHTLVIPRMHTENILDLEGDVYLSLMQAVKEVANRLRAFYGLPRVALVVEGMTVAHVHVHVIPIRKKGDLGTFNQYVPDEGELAALGERLRAAVS